MTKYNNIHTIRISLICNPPETKPRSYTGLRPHGGGDRCDHGGIDQWHHPASDPTAAMLFQNGGSYTKLLPVLYNGYLWKYDMYNIWCIYILYILYTYIWYVLYIYTHVNIDVLTSFMCYEVTCFCHSPLAKNRPWNESIISEGETSADDPLTVAMFVNKTWGFPVMFVGLDMFRFTPQKLLFLLVFHETINHCYRSCI